MENQKIIQLEQKLNQLLRINQELTQRVNFLERENNRRKSEVNQAISAINKRG